MNALIQSTLRLRDVMIVTFFILTAFSLIGMKLYQGVLRGKCVSTSNITSVVYNQFINDPRMYSIILNSLVLDIQWWSW